jgi:hypothetical protein
MGLFNWGKNRELKLKLKYQHKIAKQQEKTERTELRMNAKQVAYHNGLLPGSQWADAVGKVGTAAASAWGIGKLTGGSRGAGGSASDPFSSLLSGFMPSQNNTLEGSVPDSVPSWALPAAVVAFLLLILKK